ncbi:uncharacterized protein EV422DRAFT_511513 [Fimicolochytrium jonesii]|uniref:uncharacterized protein n=1 Tax=Fimicolochytrium jonesii TaxID=1396493 RepID=UPI0022FE8CD2|nr:uncharacterized protein EV422DRAFT_511513 [Fimicolochytrium jonesii]KAI8826813.1 hypothetical protein EV422DRAFT_511513 [Fimicolochytrium jonesii]
MLPPGPTRQMLATATATALLFLSTPAFTKPLGYPIEDLTVLSTNPPAHVFVNGSGVPTLVSFRSTDAETPSDILPITTNSKFLSVMSSFLPEDSASFHGVASQSGTNVILADTRYNVLYKADVATGQTRLLFDPTLLHQFATNKSTTGAPKTSATADNTGLTRGAATSEAPPPNMPLSGIVRVDKDTNDVLFVGLKNQIFRVPATRPNLTDQGDIIEMISSGFGRWQVADICQSDRRIVVSLFRPGTGPSPKTVPITGPHANGTAAPRPGSISVVASWTVYTDRATTLSSERPRVLRRRIIGAAIARPLTGMKFDCAGDMVFIVDDGRMTVHRPGTPNPVVPGEIPMDVLDPTTVVVRPGLSVVVTGTCDGRPCYDEKPWAEVMANADPTVVNAPDN